MTTVRCVSSSDLSGACPLSHHDVEYRNATRTGNCFAATVVPVSITQPVYRSILVCPGNVRAPTHHPIAWISSPPCLLDSLDEDEDWFCRRCAKRPTQNKPDHQAARTLEHSDVETSSSESEESTAQRDARSNRQRDYVSFRSPE